MWAWIKDKTGRLWRWHVRQFKAFGRGFAHPFAAIPYIVRNPSLFKWAVPPAVLTSGLMALVLWGVVGYTDDAVSLVWAQPAGHAWYETWLLLPLWYAVYGTLMLVLMALGVIAVYLVSIPLAGPFGELLAEEVERIETGFEARFDWVVLLRNLAITALHLVLFTAIQMGIFAMVSVLGLVPVVGQLLSLALSLITTPLLIGFAPFDYPMTVRLWSFSEKVGFMLRNFPLFYGFSVSSFLMLYIPFVNLIFLPCCVVAASRIIVEQEKSGELTIPDKRKAVLGKRQAALQASRAELEPSNEGIAAQTQQTAAEAAEEATAEGVRSG